MSIQSAQSPNQAIKLYGFGELGSTLHRPALRTSPPYTIVVEDGIILPCEFLGWGACPSHSGGVVTRDFAPVEAANLFRRGGKLAFGTTERSDLICIKEERDQVIYLGWLMHHHYGHFLLESLARSWYLLKSDQALRVGVLPYVRASLREPFRRVLRLLNIPEERLLFIEQPTRFPQIYIPEPLYELLGTAHVQAIGPFQHIAERILSESEPIASNQPVYLSRSTLPGHRRAITGEPEFESALRERGFLIVYPESLTFDEQVLLFNSHHDYIGCFGSAMHSVLFAQHRPRLHLLTSGMPQLDFLTVPSLSNASLSLVNCLKGNSATNAPRTLDVSAALEYLDSINFRQNDDEFGANMLFGKNS